MPNLLHLHRFSASHSAYFLQALAKMGGNSGLPMGLRVSACRLRLDHPPHTIKPLGEKMLTDMSLAILVLQYDASLDIVRRGRAPSITAKSSQKVRTYLGSEPGAAFLCKTF